MRKEKSMADMKSLLIETLGILLALVIGFPLAAALAAADSYPSKPIRLIVPSAPGGSNDQGAETDYAGPAEFSKFLEAETAKWGKLIKEANIKGQ